MARALPESHTAAEASTSDDYLLLLRCDEAASGSDLTDEMGIRTMTIASSAAVGTSLMLESGGAFVGSRRFDGSTQYAGRATDTDESLFQAREWGCAMWIHPDTLNDGYVLEYGEFSSPAANAQNPQIQIQVRIDGSFTFRWRSGTATARNNSTPAGLIVAGQTHHIGVSCEPDPDNAERIKLRFFVDGECVAIVADRPVMTGGTAARWIVGASRVAGSAVDTPGAFFDGGVDDVIVTKFTPDVAWFRSLYARGVRDFQPRNDADDVPLFPLFDGNGDQYTNAVMQSVHSRVLVQVETDEFADIEKVDMEWVDLTAINGIDFVRSVSWDASVDSFIATAAIRLHPRFAFYNMSPFVTLEDNPLLPDTTELPLLLSMRRIRIEVALCPMGMEKTQAGPFYEVFFDGFIRAVDITSDEVTVTAADLGCALLDVFMEPDISGNDRTYGDPAGSAVEDELQNILDDNDPARLEIHTIDDSGAGNAIVIRTQQTTTSADINGRGRPHPFQAGDEVVISGTLSYDTPAGSGDVVASTTATQITLVRTTAGAFAAETAGLVRGMSRLSYKGGKPTLYVPTSSAWNVYEWNEPASKGVLQALDDVMAQIGWRVSYKWHELRQQFRLTVFNPALTFGNVTAHPVLNIGRMSIKVDDVRNVIVGEYGDDAQVDPKGERIIYVASSVNVDSVRKYGRRPARIRTASDSLITAAAEAQDVVDTVATDLQEPIAETDVETLWDGRIEVQDEVLLLTDTLNQASLAFGGGQFGACVGVSHSIDSGKHRTTVRMRNVGSTPLTNSVSRVERHAEMLAAIGTLSGRGCSAPETPAAPTVTVLGTINGSRCAKVDWAMPASDLNMAWSCTEVHMEYNTSATFTPTSSTLKAVVWGTSYIAHGLSGAGLNTFCRLVHCDDMGNRSAASTATTFIAT